MEQEPGPAAAADNETEPAGGAGDAVDASVLVDARGTRCPLPVILAARAATGRPAGTVLRVLATDVAAVADLPAWCRMRGHTVLGLIHQNGVVDCAIRLG